jgi:hypothetical protein
MIIRTFGAGGFAALPMKYQNLFNMCVKYLNKEGSFMSGTTLAWLKYSLSKCPILIDLGYGYGYGGRRILVNAQDCVGGCPNQVWF